METHVSVVTVKMVPHAAQSSRWRHVRGIVFPTSASQARTIYSWFGEKRVRDESNVICARRYGADSSPVSKQWTITRRCGGYPQHCDGTGR